MKPVCISLVFAPTTVYASGGEVLGLVWLEVGLLLAVITCLLLSRLQLSRKVLLFVVYVVSAVGAAALSLVLPLAQNLYAVGAVCLLPPVLVLALVWKSIR